MSHDNINHPQHYKTFPIECIEITEHLDFCLGNAVKYIYRAGTKGGGIDKTIEDFKKALWYLERADYNNNLDIASFPKAQKRLQLLCSSIANNEQYLRFYNAYKKMEQSAHIVFRDLFTCKYYSDKMIEDLINLRQTYIQVNKLKQDDIMLDASRLNKTVLAVLKKHIDGYLLLAKLEVFELMDSSARLTQIRDKINYTIDVLKAIELGPQI